MAINNDSADIMPMTTYRTDYYNVVESTELLVKNEEYVKIWNKLDAHHRGRISNKDLKYYLLHSKVGNEIYDEAVTSLLEEADQNHDGFISKQEFLVLMQNTRKRPLIQRLVREAAFLTIPRSGRNAKVRKYIDEFSCWPPPFFMITISIAEIVVFIIEAMTLDESIGPSGPVNFDSVLIYNPKKRCQAWRFVTYMFIHSGYLHLLFNLFLQLLLGVTLELVHHWWRIMIVYLFGVLGGCLAASVASPSTFLAGASGGVYALEFAYLGNLILNWSEMKFAIVQAVGFALISSLDIGYAIWDTYYTADPSNTSYMAHLGGAVTGILLGVNVLRNLEKLDWEKYCWWMSLLAVFLLFSTGVIIQIFGSTYFPYPDAVCRS